MIIYEVRANWVIGNTPLCREGNSESTFSFKAFTDLFEAEAHFESLCKRHSAVVSANDPYLAETKNQAIRLIECEVKQFTIQLLYPGKVLIKEVIETEEMAAQLRLEEFCKLVGFEVPPKGIKAKFPYSQSGSLHSINISFSTRPKFPGSTLWKSK